MSDHIDVLRRYLHAIEEFAPRGVVERFFATDAVQHESPNRLFPNGRRSDLVTMLAAYDKGPTLLASQRYVLKNSIAQGDQVAAELEWTGVLRSGFGALEAGASLRAAIAIFFTFRDGKIASVRNYDCYYPF
jgi:ketosteroid isomerase-like protein